MPEGFATRGTLWKPGRWTVASDASATPVAAGEPPTPPLPAARPLAERSGHADEDRLFGGFDVGPVYLVIGPDPGLVT